MIKDRLAGGIGTWFGLGLAPKAPGTFGSLGALPFVWIFLNYGCVGGLVAFIAVTFFVGERAVRRLTEGMAEKDPGKIVVDEVCGQSIALLPLAWFGFENVWWGYLAGVVLFRFFDVKKLWLVARFDRRKDARGVMLDDVFAGIFAALVLSVILGLSGLLV
jgi:phosphatidylglycerophosphatase A